MNDRIKRLKTYILAKKHHILRRTPGELGINKVYEYYSEKQLPPVMRAAECLRTMASLELPVILPGEQIVFTRTITEVPALFSPEEWKAITGSRFIHEKGYVCNISPDYETTIQKGLVWHKENIKEKLASGTADAEGIQFLEAANLCVEAIQDLIDAYISYAEEANETATANTLRQIRDHAPTTFREALQLLRILHYFLWLSGCYHNTLGRFDQYMYPFYRRDIDTGLLTQEEAFDLLEEFFLSCNKDSDLYPGMQQGDNGQSIVLGGRDREGNYLFNELSDMCLRASYELELIDPKINIRVDKETPLEIFEKGSHLTRIGLGFPQYSNDDVIIPGLLQKGYSEEDAYNYVVAACWEFIIPKYAMDIPNIDALSLIDCVMETLPALVDCPDYEVFYSRLETVIAGKAEQICERHAPLYMIPSPVMSLLMDGTIEKARDISSGSRYNNYGIHGTGIATAVDSLAVIKKYHFEEQTLTTDTLQELLTTNYTSSAEWQQRLRMDAPKFGQDNDYADDIAVRLLDSFQRAFTDKKNERGGIYRTGTGTAMYYIFHSRELGATPDGRKAGEVIPANYSPSLFIDQKGPLSVIKSFCKPDLSRVMNGGPLTLEFDHSVFKNDESIQKLGMLVRTFITLGGHQLQLNTVNREKLLDAKVNPDKYRQLIVRVWGWSGYFVELDECYQDHVIERIEFGL